MMTPEVLFDSLYRAAPPQLATWMSRHRAGILAMLGQWLTELRAEVQGSRAARLERAKALGIGLAASTGRPVPTPAPGQTRMEAFGGLGDISALTSPESRTVLTAESPRAIPMTDISLDYTEAGIFPDNMQFGSAQDAVNFLNFLNQSHVPRRQGQLGGYDKTVIRVTWGDGAVWRGRFDVNGRWTTNDLFGKEHGGGVTWENTTRTDRIYAKDLEHPRPSVWPAFANAAELDTSQFGIMSAEEQRAIMKKAHHDALNAAAKARKEKAAADVREHGPWFTDVVREVTPDASGATMAAAIKSLLTRFTKIAVSVTWDHVTFHNPLTEMDAQRVNTVFPGMVRERDIGQKRVDIHPYHREDQSDLQSDYYHPAGFHVGWSYVTELQTALREADAKILGKRADQIAAADANDVTKRPVATPNVGDILVLWNDTSGWIYRVVGFEQRKGMTFPKTEPIGSVTTMMRKRGASTRIPGPGGEKYVPAPDFTRRAFLFGVRNSPPVGGRLTRELFAKWAIPLPPGTRILSGDYLNRVHDVTRDG